MPFAVQTRTQPGVTGRDATIFILDDGAGGRAEVWPALGFNCFRWEVVRDGRTLDLLYADAALFGDGRPTRSGVPILFPFPNRIRNGRFAWEGKEYQLPTNDPSGKNAIHGFACRRPWRVVGEGADASSAWLTGEFQASRDAPDCLALWPADYVFRVTCRLGSGQLRVEAEAVNPNGRTLPFGLGYHPYFRVPFAPEPRRPTASSGRRRRRCGRWSIRCRPGNAGRSMRPATSMRRAATPTCSSTTC